MNYTEDFFRDHRGLFKGKRRNGKWVEGFLVGEDVIVPPGEEYLLDEGYIHGLKAYEVIPETVCSFAFMFDSEKNAIYENDIIKCYDGEELLCTFIVKHDVFGGVPNHQNVGYPAFGFVPYDEHANKLERAGLRNDPAYWLDNYTVKITGNVYDEKDFLS